MPTDPWMIDASVGAPSYTAQEVRLTTVLPFIAGSGTSLSVRSGVRHSGSGADLLVQAQASPNMTVKVNTGAIIVQGAISATQGPYTWVLDTLTNLTIAAAHATLARTDLVVVRIRDAGVDTSGQRDGAVTVITGTAGGGVPSTPTDATYIEIARVTVGAAVTTITSGNISDRRPFTAAVGGIIPCNSTNEPAAPTVPPGQIIYRTDLGQYRSSDTVTWNHLAWAPPSLFVRRTIDAPSIALSTTLVDDNQLFVSVAANAIYEVRSHIIYTADPSGDLKIGWSAPAGATFDWNVGGMDSVSNTAVATAFWGANILSGADIVGGVSAVASPLVTRPSGMLVTTGTSGQFRLRWAQGTSNAQGTQVRAPSFMLLTRVG